MIDIRKFYKFETLFPGFWQTLVFPGRYLPVNTAVKTICRKLANPAQLSHPLNQ
jgi:hypothetical protein